MCVRKFVALRDIDSWSLEKALSYMGRLKRIYGMHNNVNLTNEYINLCNSTYFYKPYSKKSSLLLLT